MKKKTYIIISVDSFLQFYASNLITKPDTEDAGTAVGVAIYGTAETYKGSCDMTLLCWYSCETTYTV